MPASRNNRKKPRKKPSKEIIERREAAKRKKSSGAVGPTERPMLLQRTAPVPAARPYKDFTVDGKCSGCGSCCSSVISVTDTEADVLRDYTSAHGIDPALPEGDGMLLYLQCPFLDRQSKRCLVYPVRPGICRSYRCDKTDPEILSEYLRTTNQKDMPKARNLWELFGKTGLRTDQGEITVDNAARAELVDEHGNEYPVQVGRPLTFTMKSGKRYASALCLNLMEKAMQVFDDGQIDTIEYLDIKSVP